MLPAGLALQTYPLSALPHLGKWNQVRGAPRSTCSARCGPRYRVELPLGGPWVLHELPGAHRGRASGRMSSSGRGPTLLPGGVRQHRRGWARLWTRSHERTQCFSPQAGVWPCEWASPGGGIHSSVRDAGLWVSLPPMSRVRFPLSLKFQPPSASSPGQ